MVAKLVRYVDAAPGIRHFTFAVPEVDRLEFTAGQFVSLSAPLGEKTVTRAYSLAAPPAGDHHFEICLNHVPDGAFTPHLFSLAPGDTVDMSGPLGTFVWRDHERDVVLVATGTGVVPYRAMLHHVLPMAENNQKIQLLYGTRHPESLLFMPEFQGFQERHPRFRFLPTVTRPNDAWSGLQGRVTDHLDAALDAAPNPIVYVCGMAEMVEAVRARCKQRGLDRKQIVTEKYD